MEGGCKRRANSISQASYIRATAIAILAMALSGVLTLRAQGPGATISASTAAPAQILELRIGDEITSVMAEYVDKGIAVASLIHANLILITMDTPGGLSTSMEEIIHNILES